MSFSSDEFLAGKRLFLCVTGVSRRSQCLSPHFTLDASLLLQRAFVRASFPAGPNRNAHARCRRVRDAEWAQRRKLKDTQHHCPGRAGRTAAFPRAHDTNPVIAASSSLCFQTSSEDWEGEVRPAGFREKGVWAAACGHHTLTTLPALHGALCLRCLPGPIKTPGLRPSGRRGS